MEDPQNRQILILDDDAFAVQVLALRLSKGAQRRISTATDAKSALAYVDLYGPWLNLIVCDLHMPDYDGVEFLGELQKRGCTTPILLVSSADQTIRNGAAKLCRAYGLSYVNCFRKPVDAQMLSVVDALLDEDARAA